MEALLQGTGPARSQDDARSVHEFLLSREALRKLDEDLGLRKSFGGRNVDPFHRFASLGSDDSFEAFFRYYRDRIEIDLDPASSISALKVSAFRPEDAFRINEKLLEMSEQLIIRLNERGRQDLVRYAASEAEQAEKKAKAAIQALARARSSKASSDTERQSALQMQRVTRLQDELMSTKALLAQISAFAPENPQIQGLHKRAQILQSEIDAETARPAGKGAHQADKAAEYERLAYDQMLADKQLAAALALLDQARMDAQRRQLYFERIVQPARPDAAAEPKRLKSVLTVFCLGFVAWAAYLFASRWVKYKKSEADMRRHDGFMPAGSLESAIGAAVERAINIGRGQIWR